MQFEYMFLIFRRGEVGLGSGDATKGSFDVGG